MNTANSVDLQNEPSEDFLDHMEKNLPRQVVLYLKATGFDTATAFRSFDTSGTESDSLQQVVEMLRTQSAIMKAHIPEAKTMYGIFYDSPESFIILPGHRSQIMTFITDLANSNKRQKLDRRPLTSPSTRKLPRRRSNTPETPKSSRIPSVLPHSSPTSVLSTSSMESLTKGSEDIEEVMSLSNMPQILKELKTTVAKYLSSNDEFKHLNIVDEKEYSIFVNPATSNDTDFPISASITCNVCASKLMLPIYREKFRPANFYRHIKSCILKKNKSNEGRKTQSKMTSFIAKPTRSNLQPVTDSEENDSNDTESEQVTINDHSYGIQVQANKSLEFEDIENLNVAAEICVNTSSQSSCEATSSRSSCEANVQEQL